MSILQFSGEAMFIRQVRITCREQLGKSPEEFGWDMVIFMDTFSSDTIWSPIDIIEHFAIVEGKPFLDEK